MNLFLKLYGKILELLYLVFLITFDTSNFHTLRIKTLKFLWTTICTDWACPCRFHKLYFYKLHL